MKITLFHYKVLIGVEWADEPTCLVICGDSPKEKNKKLGKSLFNYPLNLWAK